MKYPEEDIAADLHRELGQRFVDTATVTSVSGSGVHWRCTTGRGSSQCITSCFASFGPEYYTTFERNAEELGTARTPSRDETIDAVDDWLSGEDLSALHEKYLFVDRNKRSLSRIRDEITAAAPKLLEIGPPKLEHFTADIYHLRLHAADRSCEISFYGKNEHPDAKFSWDDCELFRFPSHENAKLAAILEQWLCHQSMPSEMREKFPWLQIGELGDYYECGKPIEGEFVHSWNGIEEFYRQDWCDFSAAVLSMISAMREAGYDRRLRAGQSMSSLGLSRSRRHGLTADQHCIWFQFHDAGMDVHADFANSKLENHPVALSEDVKRLLDTLAAFDIDFPEAK